MENSFKLQIIQEKRTEQEASGSEGEEGGGGVKAGFVGSLTLLWARRNRRKEKNRTEKKRKERKKSGQKAHTHTHAHTMWHGGATCHGGSLWHTVCTIVSIMEQS